MGEGCGGESAMGRGREGEERVLSREEDTMGRDGKI